MGLFRDEFKAYEFQAEHVAIAYTRPSTLLTWDTGAGKSVAALALACLMLEDDRVDNVILVCEKNKLVDTEWPKDIEKFTSIPWGLYYGTPAKRAKLRENLPTLVLTTYDTIKRDAAVFPPKASKRSKPLPTPGPLLEALEGRRVLLVYDETTRLANRTSDTHKAHKLFVDTLASGAGLTTLAMTATPMEKDPVSLYNLGRILTPHTMPTVSEFEHDYVSSWDIFRNPSRFKNLKADEMTPRPDGTVPIPLADRFKGIVLRKRKSDPDVVKMFPKRRELPPLFVDLGKTHRDFYDTVQKISQSLSDFEQRQYVNVLRQIAGHPMALTLAEGDVAKEIVSHVSPDGLKSMGSAKTDRMLSWCHEVVKDQGAQAIIFTYFAHTVMPFLQEALEVDGYTVSVNHGGLSLPAKSMAQKRFKDGETQIFLTSDAGSKGLNLPEATYLLHYERPPLHSLFVQRSDRIHRIDSLADTVYIYSLVARGTIEEGLYELNLRRNDWSDKLLGDDETDDTAFLKASDRKLLLKQGRALHT